MNWLRLVVRFIVSGVVLMLISLITPGFSTMTFTQSLLAAAVIAVLGLVVEAVLGRQMSPYGRGGVGFVVAAAVIYFSQFMVPGMHVSLLGAVLAALLIGIVDIFLPTLIR